MLQAPWCSLESLGNCTRDPELQASHRHREETPTWAGTGATRGGRGGGSKDRCLPIGPPFKALGEKGRKRSDPRKEDQDDVALHKGVRLTPPWLCSSSLEGDLHKHSGWGEEEGNQRLNSLLTQMDTRLAPSFSTV